MSAIDTTLPAPASGRSPTGGNGAGTAASASISVSDPRIDLQAQWKPRVNPWLIAMTVALAAFMEVLDTSIANVALPHIGGAWAPAPTRAPGCSPVTSSRTPSCSR